jgi:hypothetical protein
VKEFVCNVDRCDDYCLIILLESHFRPLQFRIFEYALFAVLRVISPERAAKLTLGVNQLKACDWEQYLESKKIPLTFRNIITASESIPEAREASRRYLDSRAYHFSDEVSLSLIYTGRTNSYYDGLFLMASVLCKFVKAERTNLLRRA